MEERKQSLPHPGMAESNIDNVRRRLNKTALATPIVASLASRQALAGNCLSNMLSGNLSDPNRGQCSKGWSPGGWGKPGGTVAGYGTLAAWQTAGFNYGTYDPNVSHCHPSNPNKPDCYVGGSTINDVPAILNKNSVPSGTPLRVILNPDMWPGQLDWQLTRHLVCAYLNAALSENISSFQYILTKQQVVDLAAGTLPLPPGYSSLQSFLGSTWS